MPRRRRLADAGPLRPSAEGIVVVLDLTALHRTPYWIADAIAAPTVVLLAFTVAHAALPAADLKAPEPRLRGPMAVSALPHAPAAASPFVFGEPVEGFEVISPFGLRQLPWEEGGRLHAGVDIAAPAGLPVRAVADGVVSRTGREYAYGRFVEVRHAGGLTSFYAHLGGIAEQLRPGMKVYRGYEIGHIGNTGSSTGAHLHFEVRRKGRPLNPAYFIETAYASEGALPLKAASRIPPGVRVAYVSYIPQAKRELMEAREQEKLEAELAVAQEAAKAPAAEPAKIQLAMNTAAAPPLRKLVLTRTVIEPAAPPQAPKAETPKAEPSKAAQMAALNAAAFASSEIVQTAGRARD